MAKAKMVKRGNEESQSPLSPSKGEDTKGKGPKAN